MFICTLDLDKIEAQDGDYTCAECTKCKLEEEE